LRSKLTGIWVEVCVCLISMVASDNVFLNTNNYMCIISGLELIAY